MQKILITGFSGFVSHHFLNYLYDNELSYEVLGVDIKEPELDLASYKNICPTSFRKLNLLDQEKVFELIENFRPDYILHLAAFSSVAYSWQFPEDCFNNNTRIFLNLMGAVKKADLRCRILSVGSSEEYGNVRKEDMPLREDRPLHPVSPYAVARLSQEMMSRVYVDSFDMDIVLTRSFNHIGPYQDDRFVVPGFAKKILAVRDAGQSEGIIETGDTTIVRDFVDVRDVVRAYYMLLMEGTPGEVYNICSGFGVALSEIIEDLSDIIGVTITGRTNPELVRPSDNRTVIGSYDKINQEIGWEPEIPIQDTLEDIVKDLEERKKRRGIIE